MAPGLIGYISCCCVAFVCLMCVATVHLLAWFNIAVEEYELFRLREDQHWNSKQAILPLLIPGWIFVIWIILYVWQGMWLLFGLELIILEERSGWLYNKPSLTPPSTYLSFAISVASILGWLVLWDNESYSNYAPLCLLVTCAMAFLALARSLMKVVRYACILKIQFSAEIILSRILVHNGLALLATWSIVVLVYNIAHLLCLGEYVTPTSAGFVFLGVISAYEIILFTADLFLARQITAGLLAPYLLTIVVFTQTVLINWNTGGAVFMVALIMVGFSVLLTLTKIIVDVQRIRR